jgi:hypothetical protein
MEGKEGESDVKKGKKDGKETSVDEGKEKRITEGNDVWTSFCENRPGICQPSLLFSSLPCFSCFRIRASDSFGRGFAPLRTCN